MMYEMRLIFFILINVSWSYSVSSQNINEQLQYTQDTIQKYLYSNPTKALDYAIKYDSIAKGQDSIKYKGKGKNFLGMCHYVLGNADKAIQYYILSIKYFETLKDEWFVAMLNNNIGAAYQVRKDPIKTIAYYKLALDGFARLKDTIWMANLYNNISVQKSDLGLYDEELVYKKRAIEMYKLLGDEDMIMTIGGNLVETYFRLKDYELSEKNAKNYLSHPLAKKDLAFTCMIMLAYAYTLEAMNRFEESLDFANQALKISSDLHLKDNSSRIIKHLANLYNKMGDYKKAYINFKNYHELYDSLFNQQKDSTISHILAQYDTEKKEQQISLLSTQNELKDLQITASKRSKTAFILGLLALGLISFFALRLQYLKSKTNKQLKAQNAIISKANDEKSLLLKEIHHRVKNNLQVISSLLKLQSVYIKDDTAIKAITEGRNRVHSMALLHQNLYQEDNLKGVDMPVYFTSLIEGLFDAYNIMDGQIVLRTDITPLNLDIDTVIPLGLIANELISNSLKHAFHHVENAVLQINLSEKGGSLIFEVNDNGVGFDIEKLDAGRGSFGQKMVHTLTEKLDGTILINTENGTHTRVTIKDYQKVN